MKNYVAATFPTLETADNAINNLTEKGIAMSQISIVTREDMTQGSFKVTDAEKGAGISKAATTGGVIGGALGLLAGVGAVTIPGLGPLLFAGPIATLLGVGTTAAATATGAATGILAGGLVGALKEFGIDEVKAKEVESKVKSGHVLLFVDVLNSEEENVVKELFQRSAAEDVMKLTYK